MSARQILVTERDREPLEKRIDLMTGGVDEDSWGSVRRLHEELDHATVLHDEQVPEDIVTMNSSLILQDVDTGRQRLCTLVYPGYLSGAPDRVSVLTSLGTALLGARVGDVIEYDGEERTKEVRLIDIVYQPEAAGHKHL